MKKPCQLRQGFGMLRSEGNRHIEIRPRHLVERAAARPRACDAAVDLGRVLAGRDDGSIKLAEVDADVAPSDIFVHDIASGIDRVHIEHAAEEPGVALVLAQATEYVYRRTVGWDAGGQVLVEVVAVLVAVRLQDKAIRLHRRKGSSKIGRRLELLFDAREDQFGHELVFVAKNVARRECFESLNEQRHEGRGVGGRKVQQVSDPLGAERLIEDYIRLGTKLVLQQIHQDVAMLGLEQFLAREVGQKCTQHLCRIVARDCDSAFFDGTVDLVIPPQKERV